MSAQWTEKIVDAIATIIEMAQDADATFTHDQADRLRRLIWDAEELHAPIHQCKRCNEKRMFG